MKLSALVLSITTLLASPIVCAKDYIKDFHYTIPNALNDACQAYIMKLPEADRMHHQDGCMHVNIKLAHTPYPILNDAINQNIDENLIKELNDVAQDIYDHLKESDYTQINRYQQLRNIDIISRSDTLWQVAVDDYIYLGGAHGMPDKHFYSYDIKRHSVLKIHDILTTKDKKAQLKRLVYDAYLRHLKQSYIDQKDIERHLHTWVFYLNENFYFTPQGISFTYAPYELGPYAAGFTILNIPKNKLIGIIKPRYLQAGLGDFNDDDWSQNNE